MLEPEDEPEEAQAGIAPIGQGRTAAVAIRHGRPTEVGAHDVEERAQTYRVLGARGHLEDLHGLGPSPHRGGDRGVDHPVHRVHHLQARDPAGFRIGEAALDDARSDDDDRHLPAPQAEHLLTHGLGIGVDVVPPVLAGAAHPLDHQLSPDPAVPAVLDELFQPGGRQLAAAGLPVLADHLALQPPRELLLRGFLPEAPAGGAAVRHLAHRIEAGAAAVDDLAHVAVDGQGLVGDRPLAPAVDVGGGDVHEVDVPPRGPGELHQRHRTSDIGLERHVQGFVEDDGGGAVEDRVELRREALPVLGGQPEVGLALVDGHGDDLLAQAFPAAGVGPGDPLEEGGVVELLEPLGGRDLAAVGPAAGPDQQVDAADLIPEIAQDLGQQGLADEPGAAGDQQTSVRVVLADHATWRAVGREGKEDVTLRRICMLCIRLRPNKETGAASGGRRGPALCPLAAVLVLGSPARLLAGDVGMPHPSAQCLSIRLGTARGVRTARSILHETKCTPCVRKLK